MAHPLGLYFEGSCSKCKRKKLPVVKVKSCQLCGTCLQRYLDALGGV